MDHIVPFFDGGRHHMENIQWLCPACHKRKSADEVRRHRVENPTLYQRQPLSAEQRKRIGDVQRGRPKPPEWVAKVAEGSKRAWARKTPEERQAIAAKSRAAQLGRKIGPMSEERKRKIGEAQRRAWASGNRKPNPADAGANLAEEARLWWEQATPEQRAQRGAAISAGRKRASVGP